MFGRGEAKAVIKVSFYRNRLYLVGPVFLFLVVFVIS